MKKTKKLKTSPALIRARQMAKVTAETNFTLRAEVARLKMVTSVLETKLKHQAEFVDQQRVTISNLRGEDYRSRMARWGARLDDVADALISKIEREQEEANNG